MSRPKIATHLAESIPLNMRYNSYPTNNWPINEHVQSCFV